MQHRKEPNCYKHPGRRQAIFLSDQVSAIEARSARSKQYFSALVMLHLLRKLSSGSCQTQPNHPNPSPGRSQGVLGGTLRPSCARAGAASRRFALPGSRSAPRLRSTRGPHHPYRQRPATASAAPPQGTAGQAAPQPGPGGAERRAGLPPVPRAGRGETRTPSGDTETKRRAAAISTDKHTALHHDKSFTSFRLHFPRFLGAPRRTRTSVTFLDKRAAEHRSVPKRRAVRAHRGCVGPRRQPGPELAAPCRSEPGPPPAGCPPVTRRRASYL